MPVRFDDNLSIINRVYQGLNFLILLSIDFQIFVKNQDKLLSDLDQENVARENHNEVTIVNGVVRSVPAVAVALEALQQVRRML